HQVAGGEALHDLRFVGRRDLVVLPELHEPGPQRDLAGLPVVGVAGVAEAPSHVEGDGLPAHADQVGAVGWLLAGVQGLGDSGVGDAVPIVGVPDEETVHGDGGAGHVVQVGEGVAVLDLRHAASSPPTRGVLLGCGPSAGFSAVPADPVPCVHVEAAPDAVPPPGREGVVEALGADRAAAADLLGLGHAVVAFASGFAFVAVEQVHVVAVAGSAVVPVDGHAAVLRLVVELRGGRDRLGGDAVAGRAGDPEEADGGAGPFPVPLVVRVGTHLDVPVRVELARVPERQIGDFPCGG